ncbi:MAG: ABC transporter ATP-binding protein [Chloroflexi bacterium]|nr:ABC transporter ATP-binding protein [Chloroflexota bacterium]
MQPAIKVERIGKRYRRFHANRPTTLQESIVKGLRRLAPAEIFWALRDVSLTIDSGRTLGIIGANGAGKSTLLRLIGGVSKPDEGYVETRGRIGALLDLSAGFHPDLTGRENVFVSGVIAGLTRQEIAERFDAIVAFAELENSIDYPLRTYSTGMQMRLGFAVAAHCEPEILLIDEWLAVGDVAFEAKCLRCIRQFQKDGTTIVVVSHNENLIRELCDDVVWLKAGTVESYGSAKEVLKRYLDEMMPIQTLKVSYANQDNGQAIHLPLSR